MIFYLFLLEADALCTMFEICSVEAPKNLTALPKFVTEIDKIKQVMNMYGKQSRKEPMHEEPIARR